MYIYINKSKYHFLYSFIFVHIVIIISPTYLYIVIRNKKPPLIEILLVRTDFAKVNCSIFYHSLQYSIDRNGHNTVIDLAHVRCIILRYSKSLIEFCTVSCSTSIKTYIRVNVCLSLKKRRISIHFSS